MKKYPVYIGGEFLETNRTLEIINPFNFERIAETSLCGSEEFEKAVQGAMSSKEKMKFLASHEKSNILIQIADGLKKNKTELARILSLESAKPIKYARAEVDRAIQTFLIAAEESKRIPKEYISLDWTKNGEGKAGLINYFPIGIIAGISPFNFPLNLAAHKIAPAIASGCPILVKPASSTPLSCLELAKIIDQSELPKGAFSVLPMNRSEGNLLVTDPRINLLSFTGSPEVGWEMKKNIGKKKIVLELGGNAGVIISKETNLNSIIEKCISGAFSYSGQICIHAQRFYVHHSLFEEFSVLMKKAASELKYGDPLEEETDISNLIDEQNAIRVESWVNKAIEEGAELICGGKRKKSFYPPTLLTKTQPSMLVNSEEIFGPVSCIEKFEKIDEAVQLVNNSRFGLQCGVFSDSKKEIDYCFKHLDVGGVLINEVPTLRFDHMPYGGIKDSGFGREGIKYAMLDMLEPKILVS